ncbi:MAG TPA: baseplate J/gp47 family protein [Methanosarcina sp.]|nr:baseplate J/gp47 family protein [Methanosarcina sp.]
MGVLSSLTDAGFTYSDYPTTLTYVQNIFRTIYGQDIYLEADSKDGQLAAAFALAIYDTNQQTAQTINALSPIYAQGQQLSSSVLINGITRKGATASTATVTLSGTAGVQITGASVKDINGNIWTLANCQIQSGGTVDTLATCQTLGAISALPNTINVINTPILGWTSVTNSSSATTGINQESDSALRVRQSSSVSLPAITVLGGLYGALANLNTVLRVKVYENNTDSTDANGLLPHSIAAVVEGGVTQDIINTIALRKTLGANTNGTTSGTYIDQYGISTVLKYYPVAYTDVYINISLTRLTGWTVTIQNEIVTSLINYIASLAIGQSVLYSKIWTYANLAGASDNLTYNITSLQIKSTGSFGTADLPIAFNYAARLQSANVVFTIT